MDSVTVAQHLYDQHKCLPPDPWNMEIDDLPRLCLPECDFQCASVLELKQHMLETHNMLFKVGHVADSSILHCLNCYASFFTQTELLSHQAECDSPCKIARFLCGHCLATFSSSANLSTHLRYSHQLYGLLDDGLSSDGIILVCICCSEAFNAISELEKHLKSEHDMDVRYRYKNSRSQQYQVSPHANKYVCLKCEKVFGGFNEKKVHFKQYHLTCSNKSCDYMTLEKDELVKHEKKNHKMCPNCRSELCSLSQLALHVHHCFVCSADKSCKKKYSGTVNYAKHLHEMHRLPYFCHQLQGSDTFKFLHGSGVHKFICGMCTAEYFTQSAMDKHINKTPQHVERMVSLLEKAHTTDIYPSPYYATNVFGSVFQNYMEDFTSKLKNIAFGCVICKVLCGNEACFMEHNVENFLKHVTSLCQNLHIEKKNDSSRPNHSDLFMCGVCSTSIFMSQRALSVHVEENMESHITYLKDKNDGLLSELELLIFCEDLLPEQYTTNVFSVRDSAKMCEFINASDEDHLVMDMDKKQTSKKEEGPEGETQSIDTVVHIFDVAVKDEPVDDDDADESYGELAATSNSIIPAECTSVMVKEENSDSSCPEEYMPTPVAESVFRCELCHGLFSKWLSYTYHQSKVHSKTLGFKILKKSLAIRENALKISLGEKTTEKPNRSKKCLYCSHWFRDSEQLVNHTMIHTLLEQNMSVECMNCHQTPTIQEWEAHKNNCSACLYCPKNYVVNRFGRSSLEKHILQYHANRALKCKKCSLSFCDSYSWLVHDTLVHSLSTSIAASMLSDPNA